MNFSCKRTKTIHILAHKCLAKVLKELQILFGKNGMKMKHGIFQEIDDSNWTFEQLINRQSMIRLTFQHIRPSVK